MAEIPHLEPGCHSWVIVDRATGKAVLETYERILVGVVNQEGYEVLTARQWLQRLNASLSPKDTGGEDE